MRKTRKPIAAESIARLAEREGDVSRHFTNRGRMMEPIGPIQRVNVDFSATMLKELDAVAGELTPISHQNSERAGLSAPPSLRNCALCVPLSAQLGIDKLRREREMGNI